MIHINELTKFDYQILEFVNNHGVTSETEIINEFSSNRATTKLRIDLLSTADLDSKYRFYRLPNTFYIEKIYDTSESDLPMDAFSDNHSKYTGNVQLTIFGEKTLQDYVDSKKAKKHNYWINSVATPIGVALITAVLTTIATLLLTKYLGLYLP